MTEKEQARLEFARGSQWVRPMNDISHMATISRECSIGRDGFGFARDEEGKLVKINHGGSVKIEDFVEIRDYVTIDRATREGEFTVIGEGTKIDHKVHIAHNCKIGKHNTFAAHCLIEGSVQIGDFNTFGGGVIVQRKVKIGSNNIFGSGCVVVKDIGDNGKYVGNPARRLPNPDDNLLVQNIDDFLIS